MDAVREDVIKLVDKELESANKRFPLFHSTHEGYAVIKEEIEEAEYATYWVSEKLKCTWELIKLNDDPDYEIECLKDFAINGAIEFIQVAAMAQKFIDSLGGGENNL